MNKSKEKEPRLLATNAEEEAAELQRVLSLEENLDLPLQTFMESTTYFNDGREEEQTCYFYARSMETVERYCIKTKILCSVEDEDENDSISANIVKKITQSLSPSGKKWLSKMV